MQDIAAELERQKTTKVDYIAPQGKLDVTVVDGEVVMEGVNGDGYKLTSHAHGQLAGHLEIPKPYYDRMMAKQPELLAKNVNTWLKANPADQRMIRTMDGRVRAFLSSKYRPLDNFDLAEVVLPTLLANKAEIMSAELTETRLYIKVIFPALSDELPEGLVWGKGHHIFSGEERRVVASAVISNSDVGAGSLRFEPSVYAAYCTNLAILKEAAMRKYHVGRRFEHETDNYEIYRDETRRADDHAFWLKVKDVTMSAFDEKKFKAAVNQIKRAGDHKIVSDDLPQVIEVATKRLALPEATQNSVLSWLAKGGQLNQWGLSSAITRAAQDVDDYELATQMERAGGEVLAWTEGEFAPVAKAA